MLGDLEVPPLDPAGIDDAAEPHRKRVGANLSQLVVLGVDPAAEKTLGDAAVLDLLLPLVLPLTGEEIEAASFLGFANLLEGGRAAPTNNDGGEDHGAGRVDEGTVWAGTKFGCWSKKANQARCRISGPRASRTA